MITESCIKMENIKRLVGKISLLLSVITLLSYNVEGYPGGADPSVCGSMVPGHNSEPQSSQSPFIVTMSKSAVQGYETVDITLTSRSGNDPFHGFLIQVRKVGGDSKAIGEFKEIEDDPNARTLDCFEIKRSAMTQKSPNPKKSVTVHWIAPNDGDIEYQVFYTVVGEDSGTFWSAVTSEEKIRVTRNTQATTTSAPIQAASENLLAKWRNFYVGCGENKGCFGIPGKCVMEYDSTSDNPTTCDLLVTWSNKGGTFQYQLTGRPGGSAGYVAVGLSTDQFMGKDSVVGCTVSNPAERYHNPGQYNEKNSDTRLGLKALTHDYIEGNLFCGFEQTNHGFPGIEVDFEKSYYLLLSKAPTSSSSGLGKHANVGDKDASPQAVHISDTLIMGASSNYWLIQLHGGLMVIAWLMCASTGMFTARYLKLTHTDVTPCGKAFWFSLHIFCMAATVFLTICGSVFILIKKKQVDLSSTHPILGVIVIGLAIVQVIGAFLRPHPGKPLRPLFNWLHWGIGNTAHIVGIACIFFANDLSLADLKRFGDENLWSWILLAIVLFHVLMHVVMSIHTLWADKQMDSTNKKRAMHPGPMKTNGLSTEAPGTTFRTFMLSLYLLGMAAGAIALTALVFWPKKDDATS